MLKLYIYEHCPYCVRPRLVADCKRLPVKLEILANDDEQRHYDLAGRKIVPILQQDNGVCMTESMDICQYLDSLNPHAPMPVLNSASAGLRDKIDALFISAKPLMYPRLIMHPQNQADFPTASAKAYFQRKKEASLGVTFAQALADAGATAETVTASLHALDNAFAPSPFVNGTEPGFDDVMIFPLLRTLTIARDVINFPPHIEAYLHRVAERTRVRLYALYHYPSATTQHAG